ncbi:serine protease [Novosphingobium sp. Fuku2-ISO-50]|uniref:S1 family peptidase n=1 Tax=Novosphingobium sp. Fuku2-ISO-50 TaxID=1739114 RepID=UPI00076BC1EE|nr:serine protease [Novosphingobium sp. Fuku2-ISO-50]KUR76598.1 hypothetical protein AQZ50_13620 [Novosphingobium sp. Fuku2-ISO-50]
MARKVLRGLCVVIAPVCAMPGEAWAGEVFGTGFVVGDGHYILTALHVVADGGPIRVNAPDHRGWDAAELVASSQRLDVALLKTTTVRPALQLGKWGDVPPGLDVYVMGYPQPRQLGFAPKITAGLFNGDRDVVGSFELFQISAEIQRGNSGSPVLSPDGLVIGLVRARVDEKESLSKIGESFQNVNFALNSDLIAKFLHENKIDFVLREIDTNKYARPMTIYRMAVDSVVVIRAVK